MPDATLNVTLEDVILVAAAHVGKVTSGRIYNVTGPVRQFSGAILCFVGPPYKSVEWRIVEGHGTLTPFTTYTDDLGRCSCRFDAGGIVERVVVGVAFVPGN